MKRSPKTLDPFYATLSTGIWNIHTAEFSGLTCYARVIVLPVVKPQGQDFLDTAIHETIHASDLNMKEAEVARIASDVCRVLWKMGYRLPKSIK